MAASHNLDIWGFARAGDLDPNPTNFASRAQQWAQTTPPGTVLLVAKQGTTIRNFMIAPQSPAASNSVIHLSHTVAAKAIPLTDDPDVDISEIMNTPAISTLVFEKGSMMQRDPIIGADPSEVSRQLALTLKDGEWVAISVRRPDKKESRRYREWLAAQLGSANPNHASQNTGAVVVSIWAGAEEQSDADARAESLKSALRGFDVPLAPKRITRTGAVLKYAYAAAIGAVVAAVPIVFGAIGMTEELPAQVANFFPMLIMIGAVLGAIGLVGAILTGLGILPSFAKTTRAAVAAGTLPVPRGRGGRPKRPVGQHTDRKTGQIVPPTYGEYPLHESSFLHGAEIFAAMIAPHSGADSGSSGVAERKVVSEMRECIGFSIGVNDKTRVYLSALDLRQSVSIFGRRGSGKSHFTHGLFSWMTLDKTFPSGKRGYPGAQNTMIAFETKSASGAQEYVDRATTSAHSSRNTTPVRVDVGNPHGIGIDVFDLPGFTNRERAEFITSALKYVFGDSSIQGHSTEVLDDIFAAAFSVDDAIAAQVDRVETGKSPFYYASILLGSRGDDLAVLLATEVRSEAARRGDADRDLADSSENLDKYFVGVTQAKRQTSMEAPRNKVKNLLSLEQWWSRPKRFSWERLIENNASVVINTATYSGEASANISEDQTEAVAQFLLFSLKQAIERTCDGNAAREKWVTIFSDELSMLAAESGDVITWLQDKGRSFGVICVFASQRIEQLKQDVQRAVLGFGTVVVMNQLDKQIAAQIADMLSFGNNEWSEGDIINLEPHTAIIRTLLNDQAVPPFNVAIDDYFAYDYEFAEINGYQIGHAA